MAVMVTLEIPIVKDKIEAFLDVLRETLKETRIYEGCQKVEAFVEEGTGKVVLVELWESAEHQKAYLDWRIETGLVDALSEFLAGELQARTFAIRSDV
jgi:quinol monooxygenase YgiN